MGNGNRGDLTKAVIPNDHDVTRISIGQDRCPFLVAMELSSETIYYSRVIMSLHKTQQVRLIFVNEIQNTIGGIRTGDPSAIPTYYLRSNHIK